MKTYTVIETGDESKSEIIRFPSRGWFLITFALWFTWHHRGEFPRASLDGAKMNLALGRRRVLSITYEYPGRTRKVTRN